MAKKVVWSLRAQNDRKKIFYYWNKRNKSNNYSIRLKWVIYRSDKSYF